MDVARDSSASCDEVWSVLANGWIYGSWVVGAARIRAVDENWPEVGAQFHHSVGLWPALLDDSTEVLESKPGVELKLLARAIPVGRATILVRLTETPQGCRIEMTERAASAPLNKLPDRVQAASAAARNKECLRRLAYLAERSSKP
jgi:hypothetical protein